MANPRLLKTATRIMKKGFGIKNRLLSPYTTVKGDLTLYVLKQELRTKKFTVLAEVQKFHMDVETTAFRSRPYIEVAESEFIFGEGADKHFGQIIAIGTHVAVVPNGEVFTFREGDELQVQQTDFTYKIYVQLTGQRFDLENDV